jgi:RNA polymerase sigma-70 factor, ECF subfamily
VAPPPGSTDRVSETELISRARAGDTDAFGELVELHQAAVYRAARAALQSADEAEDVAQEAFVAAYRKLGEFRGDASFKTWLLAITWNHARTRRRTTRRWLQRFTSSDEPRVLEAPARGQSHEDALIQADLAEQVRRLAVTLPPKLRDVMLLAASGEHTLEEIGSMLGIPTGTVKWRLSEGRRHLKAKLARLGIGHD